MLLLLYYGIERDIASTVAAYTGHINQTILLIVGGTAGHKYSHFIKPSIDNGVNVPTKPSQEQGNQFKRLHGAVLVVAGATLFAAVVVVVVAVALVVRFLKCLE